MNVPDSAAGPDFGERGPVVRRFEASAHDLVILGYVRIASSLAALVGSVLMLLGRLSIPLFLVALLGLAMAAFWFRQGRKLLRTSRTAKPPALVVHRAGFALERGEVSTFVPFARVLHFEVDEEHVDITATLRDGEVLRIEPTYQGVDIYTLVRTLQDALRATRRAGRRDTDEA